MQALEQEKQQKRQAKYEKEKKNKMKKKDQQLLEKQQWQEKEQAFQQKEQEFQEKEQILQAQVQSLQEEVEKASKNDKKASKGQEKREIDSEMTSMCEISKNNDNKNEKKFSIEASELLSMDKMVKYNDKSDDFFKACKKIGLKTLYEGVLYKVLSDHVLEELADFQIGDIDGMLIYSNGVWTGEKALFGDDDDISISVEESDKTMTKKDEPGAENQEGESKTDDNINENAPNAGLDLNQELISELNKLEGSNDIDMNGNSKKSLLTDSSLGSEL